MGALASPASLLPALIVAALATTSRALYDSADAVEELTGAQSSARPSPPDPVVP